MGIHSYERYLQNLKDPHIKKQFQEIQKQHKQHAMKVAERIQNLGGTPVNHEGMTGKIQGFISQLNLPDTTAGLIEGALKGESLGIEMSEKIVRGDLDEESRQPIRKILDHDRQHTYLLSSFLQ